MPLARETWEHHSRGKHRVSGPALLHLSNKDFLFVRLLDSPWPSLSHSRGGIMPWALCLSNFGATAGMWSKDHHLLLQGQHVYRDGMECDQDSAHPGLSSPWLSAAVLALPLASLACQSAHRATVTSPAFYLYATCFLLLRGRNKSPRLVSDSSASFPFGCPPYHSFLPTPCPLYGTCHPVLLLATREHVPAPQIVHSSAHPTLSPWGGLSLPVSE